MVVLAWTDRCHWWYAFFRRQRRLSFWSVSLWSWSRLNVSVTNIFDTKFTSHWITTTRRGCGNVVDVLLVSMKIGRLLTIMECRRYLTRPWSILQHYISFSVSTMYVLLRCCWNLFFFFCQYELILSTCACAVFPAFTYNGRRWLFSFFVASNHWARRIRRHNSNGKKGHRDTGDTRRAGGKKGREPVLRGASRRSIY